MIRVPEKLAAEILQYAHKLDKMSQGGEVNEPAEHYWTAEDVEMTKPVNVASVPQRSPFRYPGGKTWLVPYIRSWLTSKKPPLGILVEPFAGGGIVGLTAGFERLAGHVVLVEHDANVAAVWQTILGGQSKWLAERILDFHMDRQSVEAVLGNEALTQRERAFAVILRNRVQRGGIMAPGAGLVKTGENGRGIQSRWYPETLSRRIREIAAVGGRFTFIEGDGIEVIRRYADDETAAFFVDPPYTVAARRLYPHWQVDHRALFGLLREVKGDVLLTYDNTREITALARELGFDITAVTPRAGKEAKLNKLLIGKNLSNWMKS